MAEKYFAKFPKITYNNYTAIDITERAVVTNDFFKNPYMFYPYDISEGERADQLSDRYYDDQYMTWMLYLGNKITDPYYQWYLSEEDLHSFLVKKYNTSISNLQDKVQFYRNNWYESDDQITVPEYNLLANSVHKYWQPFYNNTNKIAGYQRVQKDWVINTNSIRQYTANSSSFANFIVGEIADIRFDITHSGQGEVIFANTSTITLKNISGTSLANTSVVISASSYIAGRQSEANAAIHSAESIVDNIPLDEGIYWSPVSVYDYEKENNEKNRSINVIDTTYSMKISNQLSRLLK